MKKPKTTPFSLTLRAARPLIADGSEQFICLALRRVGCRLTMRARVVKQMRGFYVYEHWVQGEHPKAFAKMSRIGDAAFRAGRLAWIDDMIRREEK